MLPLKFHNNQNNLVAIIKDSNVTTLRVSFTQYFEISRWKVQKLMVFIAAVQLI